MTRRQKKKNEKHAYWKSYSCYEIFGGDEICWKIHGDPTAEIVCSYCGKYLPMMRGKEDSMELRRYGLFKKKCPQCRCRMDGNYGRFRCV